jgi:hypothetical protein
VGNAELDIARLGIAMKLSDSRAERYVDEHGNVCWKADVLPATVIEQALDAEIRSWLDVRKWHSAAPRSSGRGRCFNAGARQQNNGENPSIRWDVTRQCATLTLVGQKVPYPTREAMMRYSSHAASVLAAATIGMLASAANAQQFQARLSGFNELGALNAETGAILSNGQGTLDLVLNRNASTITYTLTYANLSAQSCKPISTLAKYMCPVGFLSSSVRI